MNQFARISVVGVHGGEAYGRAAREAVAGADVLVGSARHLAFVAPVAGQRRVELGGPLTDVLARIDAERQAGQRVAVLSSGDPGFFGIVRLLAQRFGRDAITVLPAPSSVSLAFARAGLTWDDALVVSAHGRPIEAAVRSVLDATKVAVLTAPTQPPELLGRQLVDAGCAEREVIVASRVGEQDEHLACTDLHGLAHGTFDPMSVVILLDPSPEHASRQATLAWGLPETAFAHRGGMITKAEVRAVAIGKLELPRHGVLWDVGAGSGSVAIECARLAPGLRVYTIERSTDDAQRIQRNARQHGVAIHVVRAEAPAAFDGLPQPDRVFVGGGGLDVLERALGLLAPGGRIVATHILVERAAAAWRLLGNATLVSVARASAIADGFRLQAENPVFVSWGPGAA